MADRYWVHHPLMRQWVRAYVGQYVQMPDWTACIMRVHLFSSDATLVGWLQSLPAASGPLPTVAGPTFYQRTSSPRRYYGFRWDHVGGSSYAKRTI